MNQLLLTFLTITFLTSCDCYQKVGGTIIESKTGQPIKDLVVYNKNKTWSKTKTDLAGHFKLSNVSGGMTCPPMTIVVENKEYKRVEIDIPTGSDQTIKLEKLFEENPKKHDNTEALKTIKKIFDEFVTYEDGLDGEDNKNAMTQSLKSLNEVTEPKDLELLINVWNYYDPTDYSCRNLVLNVLLQNKATSIIALKEIIKNMKSWEKIEETDFKYLLEQLETK